MFGYLLVSGITSGALYALVAMGLVIVYKATRVVNLAQGELFMLGGFFAFTFHVQLELPYLPSLILAVLGAFVLGAITYRIVFKPLMKAGLVSVLLATMALSFIMKGVARNVWGGIGDYIPFPPLISAEPFMLGGILLLPQQMVVLVASIVVMIGFAAFFKLARVGKWMQATADNVKAATLIGIPVEKLHQLAFALGASAAGAAAVLMAPLTQLYPDVGFGLFIKAFAAAVLGGLHSTPGAILGGLIVGIVEALAAGYLKSSVQEVAPFVVIMFALLFIPRGIMGGRRMRQV